MFVSVPGASPESAVPFLRAKGLAEEVVVTSGLQHAVIRSAPVVGAGSLWFAATVAGALQVAADRVGAGRRSVAPVAVGDLAATLAVADDLDEDLAGTWALEGPDMRDRPTTCSRCSPAPTPRPSISRARPHALASRPLLERPVSMHVVDALTAPGARDAPDAAERFGLSTTPFGEACGRRSPRAATADAAGR